MCPRIWDEQGESQKSCGFITLISKGANNKKMVGMCSKLGFTHVEACDAKVCVLNQSARGGVGMNDGCSDLMYVFNHSHFIPQGEPYVECVCEEDEVREVGEVLL